MSTNSEALAFRRFKLQSANAKKRKPKRKNLVIMLGTPPRRKRKSKRRYAVKNFGVYYLSSSQLKTWIERKEKDGWTKAQIKPWNVPQGNGEVVLMDDSILLTTAEVKFASVKMYKQK